MDRLIAMLERAYELGIQAQNGEVNTALAEEVAAECGEFLALYEQRGIHHDAESLDAELAALVAALRGAA